MEFLFTNVEQWITQNPFLAFVGVFAAGVLVSFTPCVYPVIPLTLGAIGARSAGSRWKGFFLSLVYVLGMAVTYAILGAFASLTGKLFGTIGSSPVSYFVVANVCLLLGLSMLGVFQLPQFSAGAAGPFKKGEGYFGIFAVGLISGLIVGPCTAPVLAAILVYVGTKQNIFYGFALLFVFGYGVGFLLILLGTFTGLLAAMPKSGVWLERVKKFFGWFLILAAEYFLVKMGQLGV
ncbi:MAG: sulfite exporter TauE/SafE family protein [Candidatus Omnitrophica bacterium]|nr:sulfite exporter TauE/SafE family protein [Candidatus Omnitrophota bacterium]